MLRMLVIMRNRDTINLKHAAPSVLRAIIIAAARNIDAGDVAKRDLLEQAFKHYQGVPYV